MFLPLIDRIPITKLREEIMHLPELLCDSRHLIVTRHGDPVATILEFEAYNRMCEEIEKMRQQIEAMQETLEILEDPELMRDIREGIKAVQNGDTVSLEEARRALGLA